MDLALIAVFKKTGGLEAYPNPGWAVQHPLKDCEGLFEGQYLISIGFVVVMILCVPLGYVNLDDNVVVQEGAALVSSECVAYATPGAFWAMLAIIAEWMVQFFVIGLDFTRVPFVGACWLLDTRSDQFFR